MNNFFRSKPAADTAAASNPNKPVIRRETVLVPSKNSSPKNALPARSSRTAVPASSRPGPPTNRFQLSATTKNRPVAEKKAILKPALRAISTSTGLKRKSATPQPEAPMFSDDDEDDKSSDVATSDSDAPRKRLKSSVSSIETSGPRRSIALRDEDKATGPLEFVHSADLTSGKYDSKFKNPWDAESFQTVSLRYPGNTDMERFELKVPRHGSDEYKPFDDIKETIKYVVLNYLPEALRHRYSDDSSGFERRFNRAWQRQSISDWVGITEEFNELLKSLAEDGTIRQELERQNSLELELVKRILDQIYSRTVSLKVEKLNVYKIGTDNVYGELLPRFVREVFQRTNLNHEHVFVDLGSGVGNVVLQAALDVGCESWGVEMMTVPCELAELQANEFSARARLWGLRVGKVNLIRANFTENAEIGAVLKRADAVLVNNQAFTSDLNEKLTTMFLDLKDGAQVVSLKPFVPDGHRISARNIGSPINQFVQRRFEWYPDYVSWGGKGGHYYIATKDTRPLSAYMRKHNIR